MSKINYYDRENDCLKAFSQGDNFCMLTSPSMDFLMFANDEEFKRGSPNIWPHFSESIRRAGDMFFRPIGDFMSYGSMTCRCCGMSLPIYPVILTSLHGMLLRPDIHGPVDTCCSMLPDAFLPKASLLKTCLLKKKEPSAGPTIYFFRRDIDYWME